MQRSEPFPFELTVTVSEPTPADIELAAYPVAQRFFGTDAELHILAAKVHPDPDKPDSFLATIVFRQITT